MRKNLDYGKLYYLELLRVKVSRNIIDGQRNIKKKIKKNLFYNFSRIYCVSFEGKKRVMFTVMLK